MMNDWFKNISIRKIIKPSKIEKILYRLPFGSINYGDLVEVFIDEEKLPGQFRYSQSTETLWDALYLRPITKKMKFRDT